MLDAGKEEYLKERRVRDGGAAFAESAEEKPLASITRLLKGESTSTTDTNDNQEGLRDLWDLNEPRVDSGTLKHDILQLSADQRNCLTDPPEGTDFVFNLATHTLHATRMLAIDPRLQRLRFNLVPAKTTDTLFWRNYFYRVHLLQQQARIVSQVESLNAQPRTTESNGTVMENNKRKLPSPKELEIMGAIAVPSTHVSSPSSFSSSSSEMMGSSWEVMSSDKKDVKDVNGISDTQSTDDPIVSLPL